MVVDSLAHCYYSYHISSCLFHHKNVTLYKVTAMAHNTTTINLCQLKFLTINQVNYTKHQQNQKKETTETLPACECLEQS